MKCPQCQKEMQQGFAEIKGTWVSFLVFGLSHQSLFFTYPEGRKQKLLTPNTPKSGFSCPDCLTLSI